MFAEINEAANPFQYTPAEIDKVFGPEVGNDKEGSVSGLYKQTKRLDSSIQNLWKDVFSVQGKINRQPIERISVRVNELEQKMQKLHTKLNESVQHDNNQNFQKATMAIEIACREMIYLKKQIETSKIQLKEAEDSKPQPVLNQTKVFNIQEIDHLLAPVKGINQQISATYKKARAASFEKLEKVIQSNQTVRSTLDKIKKMKVMQPHHFGKHICTIEGKPVVMAGMAHLVNYNQNRNTVDIINQLHQAGFNSIISFHDQNQSVKNAITASGKQFSFENIFLADWQPFTMQQFDRFYEAVKREVANNKTVACYCGEGHGRSGTMLASLSLREVLAEKVMKDPQYLYNNQARLSLPMLGKYTQERVVQVSPAVYEAVARARTFSEERVETTQNIKDLMALENHILAQMRKSNAVVA